MTGKPKMIKYRGQISTWKVGSECEFEFEVEDYRSLQEIQDAAREAAFDFIDWHFEKVEDEQIEH